MKFFPAKFFSVRAWAASLFTVALLSPAHFARAQGGLVTAWGDQTNPPGNPTNVIAVTSGSAHNLVLRSDGTVVAWGNNAYGQTTVPAGLSNVVDIGAGQDISLALKADGSLTNWGTSSYSQSVVPAAASNVVQAVPGGFHILVLRADGTVFAWGLNDYGQTTIPVGLRNVIAIAAGNRHNVALKEDGTVTAWGGTWPAIANVPPGLSNVVAIAANYNYSLALKADGTVVGWGQSDDGLLNFPPGATNDVVGLGAGFRHCSVLKSNGSVMAWGYNFYGQANVPINLPSATALAAGYYSTFALTATNLPLIVQRPFNRVGFTGSTVKLRVRAQSPLPLAYQWQFYGTNLPSATNTTLVLSNLAAIHEGPYAVIVSNSKGSVTSPPAAVTKVDAPPFIAGQPANTNAWPGRTVTFSVVADGTAPLSYQWRLNNVPINGATNATLLLTNVGFAQAGNYSVVVTNIANSITSTNAYLRVTPIQMWGITQEGYGVTTLGDGNVPNDLTNVVAIGDGDYHGLAIKTNNTVVAWGYNYSGQTNVPVGLSDVLAVDGGEEFSVALKGNGTVTAWGSQTTANITVVPPGLNNVVAVDTGAEHTLALRFDGTVASFGQSLYTNLPPGLSNVVAVSAGGEHSLFLKSDGTVVGSVYNTYGQITIPPTATNVIAISAGGRHSLALRGDGTVVAWGSNGSGQSQVPAGLSNVVAISAGGSRWEAYSSHSLALKSDGTVVAWGGANYITPPTDLTNVIALRSGRLSGMALVGDRRPAVTYPPRNTSVYIGRNTYLQARALGALPLKYQWRLAGTNLPGATSSVLVLTNVQPVQGGNYTVVVTNTSGSVTSQVGVLTVVAQAPLVTAPVTNQTGWPGRTITLAATMDGSLPMTFQWQLNGVAIPGATNSTLTLSNVKVADGGEYTLIANNAYGSASSTATVTINRIIAWGRNTSGQCNVPPGLTNVVAVAGGNLFSMALLGDGSVVAWGSNSQGQTNVPAAALSEVVAIAAGSTHAVALKNDGTVVGWGSSSLGQLPAPSGLSDVIAISSRGNHTLALKSNGTVVAWGRNNAGQTNVPPGLSNVVAISAGGSFSLALTREGNLFGWGDNLYGQSASVLTSNIAAIVAAELHTIVLRTNEIVSAWGYNFDGQISISGRANVIAIGAGNRHSFGVRPDGTLTSSGKNDYGQAAIPAGLLNVIAITGGGDHTLAIVGDDPPARYVPLPGADMIANQFQIPVQTVIGRTYALQFTDSLSSNSWTVLPMRAGTGGEIIVTDQTPSPTQRFYRVRQW